MLRRSKRVLSSISALRSVPCRSYSIFRPRSIPSAVHRASLNRPSDGPNVSEPEAQKEDNSNFVMIFFVLSLSGGVFLYFMAKIDRMQKDAVKAQKDKRNSPKIEITGDWTLVDSNAMTLSSNDLRGSYYVITFGTSACSEEQKDSLRKLSKAVKIAKLKGGPLRNLRQVFVSLNPEKDTPSILSEFVESIDDSISSGSGRSRKDFELRRLIRTFKIEVPPNEGEKADFPQVSFLVSSKNQFVKFVGVTSPVQKIAESLVAGVQDREDGRI